MAKLNLISPEEESLFYNNGYLLLRSAISLSKVKSILAEVKRLVDEANATDSTFHEEYYNKNSYKLQRIFRLTNAFDYLIDHPLYFGKIVSLMGTHIQLMDAEIFVRGAAEEKITGFHTDLGPGMQKLIYTKGSPLLELKAQIFLTDLSQPNSSNFALFPGTHRKIAPDSDKFCMLEGINRQIGPDGALPPGAIQILANAGDVLLFPHNLWHAVAPNRSGRTRYSISLRYGQLALRPLERFDPVLTDTGRKFTARQRRLLGDLGEINPSPYRPSNQENLIYSNKNIP